ncbi:MAG: HlyD family efflux transporter periplasmic adaptor subunit [Bacteriovoracaceae bacterium]|nr:HlyD family efflux transporter periplasmic adaptor subunit [Bacteriovoracaceae bacterium]
MKLKSLLSKENRHLSQSVLLEEGANPFVLRLLTVFLSVMVVLFFIWAHYMEIDEVAVAKGKIIPVNTISKVQHQDGGLVRDILVRRGQGVRKGQLLLRFDSTIIRSEYKQATGQLKSVLIQMKNVKEQLQIREGLYKKGLNSKISFLTLQEKFNDLEGRKSETIEIVERLRNQLANLEIRSPIDGVVHFAVEHPVGSIIESGATIFEIVPADRKLVAEVMISTSDIGHVVVGQAVTIKFNTYNYGRFGGMIEDLKEISAMTILDPEGNPYYRGILELSKNHLGATSAHLPVIPGMTLIAEIKTGKKSILEYLLKPVHVSVQSSFRER